MQLPQGLLPVILFFWIPQQFSNTLLVDFLRNNDIEEYLTNNDNILIISNLFFYSIFPQKLFLADQPK